MKTRPDFDAVGSMLAAASLALAGCSERAREATAETPSICADNNGGIVLPAGFCASVFADDLGHVRHLSVAENGDVYVNTWSSRHTSFRNAPGGFVVGLRDADGDGRAELTKRFGTIYAPGEAGGGTGIAIFDNALYVEADAQIVRYYLSGDSLLPAGGAVPILSGLPGTGDHPMHPFAIRSDGTMFVNSGSPSNSCQQENRALESPGKDPCTELFIHAGIWRYDVRRTGQTFSHRERYATGMRNTVAVAVNPNGNALYAAQHGRDQLSDNWPKLFTIERNNELPAEIFARVDSGDDFGWPYCYYDPLAARNVLAPEYGGDGNAEGDCVARQRPDVVFPAHWAPDGVAFYTGESFPHKYRGGAFITFHGSWNRRPEQAGFLVAFVPFVNGQPAGTYEEFATGFAGPTLPADPAAATFRPTGVAAGADALYVSDDTKGRVWKIAYVGEESP